MNGIKESDWKYLRNLRSIALERLCQRILTQLNSIALENEQSYHERYLAIYREVHEQDKIVSRIFNASSRSTAWMTILALRAEKLITDEEFEHFSDETQWAARPIQAD